MTPLRSLASFSLLQVAADWQQDRKLSERYLAAKDRQHERAEAKRKPAKATDGR